jgi:hypothetical protein
MARLRAYRVFIGLAVFALALGVAVGAAVGVERYVTLAPNTVCYHAHPVDGSYLFKNWGTVSRVLTFAGLTGSAWAGGPNSYGHTLWDLNMVTWLSDDEFAALEKAGLSLPLKGAPQTRCDTTIRSSQREMDSVKAGAKVAAEVAAAAYVILMLVAVPARILRSRDTAR